MTLDRDFDRRIRDFYVADVPALPDHVRLAVHDAVVDSPRRTLRARRPWQRRSWLALAVVVLAVAGAAIVGRGLRQPSVIVGPGPSTSPVVEPTSPRSPTPTATSTTSPTPSVAIGPGRVRLSIAGVEASVMIPEGWGPTIPEVMVFKDADADHPPEVRLWTIDAVNKSPCDLPYLMRHAPLEPGPGSLVTLFLESSGYGVTDVEPIEVGGFRGWTLDIHVPATLDACDTKSLNLWSGPDGGKAGRAGDQDRLWILDVNGTTIVVDGYWNAAIPADEGEVQAILDSLEFAEAPNPSPSPSPSIDPGTGLVQHELEGGAVAATVWTPPGWETSDVSTVTNRSRQLSATAKLKVLDVSTVFKQPCTLPNLTYSEDAGDSVEFLSTRIHQTVDYHTTPDAGTTVDRFDGVTFDLTIPDDLSRCDGGSLRLWVGQDRSTESALVGEHHRLAIVDVGGRRLMIDAEWGRDTEPQDQAALLEMVRTIVLEPLPRPLPSVRPELEQHDLRVEPATATVWAPPGWESVSPYRVTNRLGWSDVARLEVTVVGVVFSKPCTEPGLNYGSVGNANLATRLHATGIATTPDAPIQVGTYDGVTFDLVVPEDLGACEAHSLMLWAGESGIEMAYEGEHHRIAIVDVGGQHVLIDAQWSSNTTPQVRAELIEMLRTIEIEAS